MYDVVPIMIGWGWGGGYLNKTLCQDCESKWFDSRPTTLNKRALGISVLRVLTLLESGFRFSHRKSVVFRFLYLLRFVVFLYLHAVFVFKAPSKWSFGFGIQHGFRFEAKKKNCPKRGNTFLACYVLFSQFRHVMFSREFTFSSFINYAYICT